MGVSIREAKRMVKTARSCSLAVRGGNDCGFYDLPISRKQARELIDNAQIGLNIRMVCGDFCLISPSYGDETTITPPEEF